MLLLRKLGKNGVKGSVVGFALRAGFACAFGSGFGFAIAQDLGLCVDLGVR